MLWILDKYEVVVQSVVIVIELHDSAHEGIVGVDFNQVLIIVVLHGDHDRLFEKMGCLHDRVGKKLAEVFHARDSLKLFVGLCQSLDVRIPCTVLNRVANRLAADAAHILAILLVTILSSVVIVLLVLVLRLVRAVLAAELVLSELTAAPPHLATKLAIMRAAAPLKVLLLIVLTAALLASLHPGVEFALALNQLLDAYLGFVFVHG